MYVKGNARALWNRAVFSINDARASKRAICKTNLGHIETAMIIDAINDENYDFPVM